MSETRVVHLNVNGRDVDVEVDPRTLLCDVLRSNLRLTGTHVGCEHGVCGACTVLLEGRAVRSCLMLAPQAEGLAVETIEGIARPDAPHPVQRAMHEQHGLQCGFCTAGIVVSLVGAMRQGVALERAETEVLEGHLCRCTGYVNIRAAIRAAWAEAEAGPAGEEP